MELSVRSQRDKNNYAIDNWFIVDGISPILFIYSLEYHEMCDRAMEYPFVCISSILRWRTKYYSRSVLNLNIRLPGWKNIEFHSIASFEWVARMKNEQTIIHFPIDVTVISFQYFKKKPDAWFSLPAFSNDRRWWSRAREAILFALFRCPFSTYCFSLARPLSITWSMCM